jgi:hypothetical protein
LRAGTPALKATYNVRSDTMKFKYLSLLLACVLLLTSCTGVSPSASPLNIENLSLSIYRTDLRAFTMSPDGEFYAIPVDGVLTQLSYDGEEIKTYPGTEQFYVPHAHEEYIYAYDSAQHKFARVNTASGDITSIGNEIVPNEIKNIVVAGDTLYALLVLPCEESHDHLKAHDYSMNADGYMDYGEQLIAFDVKSGKMTDTKIEHVIAIYAGADNTLYYYAYLDNSYRLYSYSKGKSTRIADMSEVNYLATFVYENNQFVYLSARDRSIWIRDMTNGQAIKVYDEFLIFTAADIQYYAGNVTLLKAEFLETPEQSIRRELYSFNVEHPFGVQLENLKVTVSTGDPGLLNTGIISEASGITISYKMDFIYEVERTTALMAGEPDVDVYLGYATSIETSSRLNTGLYVPLNQSGIIKDYLDNCFDYISDIAHTPSGDTWMLPLYAGAVVLWYVPENMERFGVTPEDIRYFDGFVETVKRLNEESTEQSAYVDFPLTLMQDLQFQYETTYHNYEENKVDYNTDLFTRIFKTIYEDFTAYGDPHPIFRSSILDEQWRANNRLAWEQPCYDKRRVIFKQAGVDSHMNRIIEILKSDPLDGWRALPMPRVSEDVQGNAVYLQYAVINPLSRNKETAMKLLETIAANPLEMIRERHFLTKDPEAYREYYDISQPGFHDLLQVFQDGMVVIGGYPGDYNNHYIAEYQSGRLTAEEAIMTLQREVEMWLNE